jgi:hypothetical protein
VQEVPRGDLPSRQDLQDALVLIDHVDQLLVRIHAPESPAP